MRSRMEASPSTYSNLMGWSPVFVVVRWPSMSSPFTGGYRRMRDRAHAMTTHGRAAEVLAHLLGYLGTERETAGRGLLKARGGYSLHCVGHSFGGRLLAEAIQASAISVPRVLSRGKYPWTVDSFVVFQMAARPDVFQQQFERLVHDSPIGGPVVLTHSKHDRANGRWHSIAEGVPGVGLGGAEGSAFDVGRIKLHKVDEPYAPCDFSRRVVNVDSSWRFRRGRWLKPEGAHSDFWYPESAHLVLSVANLSR